MTPRQLIFNLNMNTRLWVNRMNSDPEFKFHCNKLMQFPAHHVLEAFKTSERIHGVDKPRYFHIKAIFEICLAIQKREHEKPMTPKAKDAIKSWAKTILES